MTRIVFLLGILIGHACAQSTLPVDPNVVLKVTVASDQREFRIGEAIPLQLSFSSTVKNQYQLNMAQYDRGARMNYEQFTVSPAGGSLDPLPRDWGNLGGITTYQVLKTEPASIKVYLNEWVRFTQPGEYRLIVTSNRVGVRDPASPSGTSPAIARSNEITLKIVRADPVWQKRTLSDAVAKLDAPRPHQPEQVQQYDTARRQAAHILRFLGTADATREMVKRIRGEDPGGNDYIFTIGVISSPERSVARTALEEALADPDHPIVSQFLYALGMVNSDPNATNATWRETNQRSVEQLLTALPGKRGNALSISLSTALYLAWDLNETPQQTTEKLAAQLVLLFDKLPLREQNTLLSFHWDKVKSPSLLPMLKRYAQSYRDFSEMRAEPAYESLQLSGNALRRWYELDPSGARSAIIAEISRPRPRFDARVLGLLPDKTLPEVDFVLAEHFAASDDLDGKSNLASLIARYATDAILPQVIEQLDPKIGKWACAIQSPILAYVLRVSPVSARPRIEKAIAVRGPDFSACNHGLFQAVSEIQYDPLLEDLGIKSLDDPDPQVVTTAATMLGNFGSPAAESALLDRYASWSQTWAGRETELDDGFPRQANDNLYQLGLGQTLVQALATGQAWLADKATLQRLAEQTKVRQIRRQLDNYLKLWDEEPFPIAINSSTSGFSARVGQYDSDSIDALTKRLAQFPSGTRFTLVFLNAESSTSKQAVELRKFLTTHGMSVAGEKQLN